MTKVYLASDHAGFALKGALASFIGSLGHEVVDQGPFHLDPDDDYPDFVTPCAQKVAADPTAFGIVVGKSGEGEAMCANRVHGVRAAVYYGAHPEIVSLAREHNNANVLSLSAQFLTEEDAKDAVKQFLSTAFSNDERHMRRLAKF